MTLSNWLIALWETITTITPLDGITLFMLIFGPVSAVCLRMHLMKKRDARNRKWELFRILMRDRSQVPTSSSDYLGALNLIEAEFNNETEIINALTTLNSHIRKHPKSKSASRRYEDKIVDLNMSLIDEIAKSLEVKLVKKEIYRGSILSGETIVKMSKEDAIRTFLAEIAIGERSFPVNIKRSFENRRRRRFLKPAPGLRR